MTNGKKVEMGNISKALQKQIAQIKAMEGSVKKIDSEKECKKLSELLSSPYLNRHETEYITGLMDEYQSSDNDSHISKGAKDVLKNIKKSFGDKNDLNEAEARALLELIKNSRNDYNPYEIKYFKNALIEAGFGYMVDELEMTEQTGVSPTEEQIPDTPTTTSLKNADNNNKQSEVPSSKMPSEVPAETLEVPSETPSTDEAEKGAEKNVPVIEKKELTAEQKQEAQDTGVHVSNLLGGRTNTAEQAIIQGFTKDKVNSENIVEFMKGYEKGDASDSFFEQLSKEYSFPQKVSIAKDMALKLRDYIEAKYGKDDKNYKIIDGIIASDNYNGDNAKRLDSIVKAECQTKTEPNAEQKP